MTLLKKLFLLFLKVFKLFSMSVKYQVNKQQFAIQKKV